VRALWTSHSLLKEEVRLGTLGFLTGDRCAVLPGFLCTLGRALLSGAEKWGVLWTTYLFP